MDRFLVGDEQAWAELERRATGRCVRFGKAELPPGTMPPRAAVGFEVHPASGAANLYVDRGLTYRGPHAEVRNWIESGQRTFPCFGALRAWVQTSLAAAYLDPAPCPRCNTKNGVVDRACRRCGALRAIPPRLGAAVERVRGWIEGREVTLLTGSISTEETTTALKLPHTVVEATFRSLADGQHGFGLMPEGHELLLFRYPVPVTVYPTSLPGRLRAFFGADGKRRRNVRVLAERRAALTRELDRRCDDLCRLQEVEVSLLEEGKQSNCPVTQRQLARRVRAIRHEIQRLSTIERVLRQQVDVLSTHIHHLTLSASGHRVQMPNVEELTMQAAGAEELVQRIRDNAALAESVEVTPVRDDTSQEEAAILQEFSALATTANQPTQPEEPQVPFRESPGPARRGSEEVGFAA